MLFHDWKIPEPDEDGFELNYMFNAIVFDDFGQAERDLLLAIRSDRAKFDFAKVIAPPKRFMDEMSKPVESGGPNLALAWCEGAWGTLYNPTDLELVRIDGKEVFRFTTLETVPTPVLRRLAKMFPHVSWRYYGYAAFQTHAAEGSARDGEFAGEEWRVIGANGLGERGERAARMTVGDE